MYSIVVPVFKNEGSISRLVERLEFLNRALPTELEVVFVVDGSPDRSFELLTRHLEKSSFRSKLILLSRNFGSFSAIRAGMKEVSSEHCAVMSADLQEPAELMVKFYHSLTDGKNDLVVGTREGRQDRFIEKSFSQAFWGIFKVLVEKDVPWGGVDVFSCNQKVRECLLSLKESNSSLIGLLYWMGFRRETVTYVREKRQEGRSGWTFGRKLRYCLDSIFSFSDLPIRILTYSGALAVATACIFSVIVFGFKAFGLVKVSGYAATIVTITFFAGLNAFGLGIVGMYVWRTFENTKDRPDAIVMCQREFGNVQSFQESSDLKQATLPV